MTPAAFEVEDRSGATSVRLSGDWTLRTMPQAPARVEAELRRLARGEPRWDLSGIGRLDTAGALILWRAWGRRLPSDLDADPAVRHMLEWASRSPGDGLPAELADPLAPLVGTGRFAFWLLSHFRGLMALAGQLLFDVLHLLAHPREIPWREFSATVYKSGALALPVTALVGFLIGVVISYLSALQLRTYGADQFIVNILGVGIIREFAPVLVAILVAGRSGSAITAQIGVMRVTEEIDALATMGVSRTVRLVLPRVLALALAVPLLVVWTSIAGLAGGMLAAELQLDLDIGFLFTTLLKVVPIANLWLGGIKGLVFGVTIGLVACHFGLRVRPNTESLSANTTSSVVTAITTVILLDALFAILTRSIGVPA